MSNAVAKRYARALFQAGVENDAVDELYDELHDFQKLLKEQGYLRAYFITPEIDRENKIEKMNQLFSEKVHPLFLNFIKVLIYKNRHRFYNDMVQQFETFYDQEKNRIKASVTTAVPLNDELKAKIKSILSETLSADIILEEKVDTDILGGLIVETQGKVLDNSVRRKLNAIYEKVKQ